MTARACPEPEDLLTPAEVAALFRVDLKTVTRWAKAGKLTSVRTLGGHQRYRRDEVNHLRELQEQAFDVVELRLRIMAQARQTAGQTVETPVQGDQQ